VSERRDLSEQWPPEVEIIDTPTGHFITEEVPAGYFDPPDTETYRERMRLLEEARRRDIPRLIALRKEWRRRYREGRI
jgi:hypothetical protein